MTKEQALQLKGIAILFMIWGHLFSNPHRVLSVYQPLLSIGDLPLVTILSRATGPVSFFLFLSGYGLFIVNQKGDKHRFSRIIKLLLTYWIVLFITVPIGLCLKPDGYDLSLPVIFCNIIGLNPSYIPEAWFMLPYILLAMTTPWEIRLLKTVRCSYFLPLSFFLGLFTSFLLSRFGSSFIYSHRVLYTVFCWFHFQFPFLLGMACAQRGGPTQLICSVMKMISHSFFSSCSSCQRYMLLCLAILIVVRCMITSSAPHAIYVFLFILIWVNLRIPNWMSKILVELGNRSVSMWFVHTTIGLYLFADWINWLQNPFLVFLSVAFASWIFSIVVGFICEKLTNAANLIYYRNTR